MELNCSQADAFDLEYYLFAYPDIVESGYSPFQHYCEHGWKEDRNPSKYFNTKFYITEYPEALEYGDNPLQHYIVIGREAGYLPFPDMHTPSAHSPHILQHLDDITYFKAFQEGLFDPEFYLNFYPDVRDTGQFPLFHFRTCGWKEQRNPSAIFDSLWYTQEYLNDNLSLNALLHYMRVGKKSGFVASKITDEAICNIAINIGIFDPEYYTFVYPDVMENNADPFAHYCVRGWKEGRNPSTAFNTQFYLKLHGKQLQKNTNPLRHYITSKNKTSIFPNTKKKEEIPEHILKHLNDIISYEIYKHDLFDAEFYLANNPDVEKSGISPFTHFTRFGWNELRNPSQKFDISWYTHQYLDGDFSRNAILHYIHHGQALGNMTKPSDEIAFQPGISYAENATPKRACLFAGYDPDGIIDDYVIEYIEELSQYADVYYLADSVMSDTELGKLAHVVQGAWSIRHGGYDFGSWSLLASELVGWDRLMGYDELLLVNDSCYLLRPLGDVFKEMDSRTCDWWGLQATKWVVATDETQSLDPIVAVQDIKSDYVQIFEDGYLYEFHVGIYFITYRRNILSDPTFQRILSNYEVEKNKSRLIRKYEIGLTRWLISRGYEFGTYIDDVYPKHPMYTEIIFSLIAKGFPLFKRYMISENAFSIPDLSSWKERLKAAGIDKDLSKYEANVWRVAGHGKLYCSFNLDRALPDSEIPKLDTAAPKYDNWWAFPVCVYSSLFNDNTRALFEFVKNDPAIKKVVLTRKKEISVSGENVISIPLQSGEGQYYLLRCRNIFLKHTAGVSIGYPLSPRLHNFYNLWHGIPLKRIGYTSLDLQNNLKMLANEDRNLKAVIAASDVDHLAMTAAYWPLTYNDIWVTGLPRHDFITCDEQALPLHLKEQSDRLVKQLAGRKLIFFAPTFRNDTKDGYYHFTNSEQERLTAFLQKNTLVMGIREHMADKARRYSSQLTGDCFIDLSDIHYQDVESILRHAHMLITDYSSTFIDFLLTKRPVISFAYDYDQYAHKERGLFYNLDWCFPGPITKTVDALLHAAEHALKEPSTAEKALYDFKSRIFLKYNDSDNCKRLYKQVITHYEDAKPFTYNAPQKLDKSRWHKSRPIV